MRRELMWTPWSWPGLDHLRWDGLRGAGQWLGVTDERVVRVPYEVEVDAGWRTRSVTVAVDDDLPLGLACQSDGGWTVGGGAMPELDGCTDVDVEGLAAFNTLPIRRLGLAVGESADIDVVYVRVFSGRGVERGRQRYTRLGERHWSYESGAFSSDLTVDADGFVLDYRKVARRLWPEPQSGVGPVPRRLTVATLGARDVGALRAFYEALGWRTSSPTGNFAAFPLGGALLALYDREALDAEAGAAAPVTLAINVDAREGVDAAIQAVRAAGATVLAEPVDRDWGGRSAYFADPEGNVWEVAWLPDSAFDERGGLVWPYE